MDAPTLQTLAPDWICHYETFSLPSQWKLQNAGQTPACLEDIDARNEFQCSLAEKPRELELILSGQNATGQQWTSITSALHEATAHTIGYKRLVW